MMAETGSARGWMVRPKQGTKKDNLRTICALREFRQAGAEGREGTPHVAHHRAEGKVAIMIDGLGDPGLLSGCRWRVG